MSKNIINELAMLTNSISTDINYLYAILIRDSPYLKNGMDNIQDGNKFTDDAEESFLDKWFDSIEQID